MKLKPCPFCGQSQEIITHWDNFTKKRTAEIKCSGCGVLMIVGAVHFSIEWAILKLEEKWNRRINE